MYKQALPNYYLPFSGGCDTNHATSRDFYLLWHVGPVLYWERCFQQTLLEPEAKSISSEARRHFRCGCSSKELISFVQSFCSHFRSQHPSGIVSRRGHTRTHSRCRRPAWQFVDIGFPLVLPDPFALFLSPSRLPVP